MSPELNLLITSVIVVTEDNQFEQFKIQLENPSLNWEKVHHLLDFHQIIPVFYKACSTVSFTNEYVASYEVFSKKHAIRNIAYRKECIRIIQLLKSHSVKALPYKGVLFLNKFYKDEPIRQMSDLDIVVEEKQAFGALRVLLNDGYVFSLSLPTDDNTLNKIIKTSQGKEVSLEKVTPMGVKAYIDFHWHINGKDSHNLNLLEIFSQTEAVVWDNKSVDIPTTNNTLIMLLSHHGARDVWARVKFLIDLRMFLKMHGQDFQEVAEVSEMKRTFNFAIYAVNEVFKTDYIVKEEYRNKKALKQLLTIWDKSDSYQKKMIPKLRTIYLNKSLLDTPLGWREIIRHETKYFSGFNPQSDWRIAVFPERFILLNAISKFISRIIEKNRISPK